MELDVEIYNACKNGHIDIVKSFLNDKRVDINQPNKNGATPFYIACKYGHIEIVKLLLKSKKVEINQPNSNEQTPFWIACYEGHLDIVNLLLSDERINVSKPDKDGSTPFFIACQNGHIEIVKVLLNDKRVDISETNKDGQTPFWIACCFGRDEIVKLFLRDKFVDINQANKNGATPFFIACFNGKTEIVRLLLDDEIVDINKVNGDGWTPFYIACENGHFVIVEILLNDQRVDINQACDSGKTPFYSACSNGHIEIVRLLNDNRVDINKGTNDGKRPFYIACQNKHIEIVKLLLNENVIFEIVPFYIACEYGHIEIVELLLNDQRIVNINNAGEYDRYDGETVFFIACKKGHNEIVKLLLNDKGMDIMKENIYDQTPFYTACQNGHIEVVKVLLNDERVEINQADKYGKTPFYIACRNGHSKIVELLLDDDSSQSIQWKGLIGMSKLFLNDRRIDINKVDEDGQTPLYIACENGKMEVVKSLLNNQRVDINKVNGDGWTPFYIACQNGHIEVVKLLLNDKRVDIHKASKDRQTPFYIACEKGHIEIVKYFLASEREINLNQKNNEGKTALSVSQKPTRNNWETEKDFQTIKKNCLTIAELIKSFQQNPNKVNIQLRKQLGLIESTYEIDIEYNNRTYRLKETVKTLQELEHEIRSRLKLQQNGDLILEFNKNGKMYVLDKMEDLEDGMTIKVSISTQSQSQSNSSSPLPSSSSLSSLTIFDPNPMNCWWNTKPNELTQWEEKGYAYTKYLRSLLRDNNQNVVHDENEYLKKLEILMPYFGGDINQVNKAYALFNDKLFDSFQNYRSSLSNQQRANPGIFKKNDWQNGNDKDTLQRYKFHGHYTNMAEIFDWNHSKFLHSVPMVHGTNETALQEICQTGLAATGATDAGYYGQGMYFSSSLFYSSKYTKDCPEGKPFIICMVTPGNVYPVIEPPHIQGIFSGLGSDHGFFGKPCKSGYQSHYTLVNKHEFAKAYPITGVINENAANELVVFDKAQVLPIFVVYWK